MTTCKFCADVQDRILRCSHHGHSTAHRLVQSVAADMLMNMDLDFEALGGKRLIPLPSLRNLESQLKEDVEHSAESGTESSMAGMALHRLGQGGAALPLLSACVSLCPGPAHAQHGPQRGGALRGALRTVCWRLNNPAPCRCEVGSPPEELHAHAGAERRQRAGEGRRKTSVTRWRAVSERI